VLHFYRWAMVNKRKPEQRTGDDDSPDLPAQVAVEDFSIPKQLDVSKFDPVVTGGSAFWGDYEPGERILHPQGMTIEDAEHQMATRLYQNTARVHFNHHTQKDSRLGKRIIYGGHIISLAHMISYDGLENALRILAFNSGAHANPTVAGDTLYAFTDVIDRVELGRDDLGALRLRLVAVKNQDPSLERFEIKTRDPESGRERYPSNLVLDLDYTVLIPKRP
jgi:2-methylfumaryl-CoA hydratase